MPTIKFKLKDPKYCGKDNFICIALAYNFDLNPYCKILSDLKNMEFDENRNVKRPQSCIDKFGE